MRPKNGSEAMSERAASPSPFRSSRPRSHHSSRQSLTCVRCPEPHELALVERLHPGGVSGRLVPEHVRAAEIERDPVGAKRSPGCDHGVAGIARRRHHDEVSVCSWNALQSWCSTRQARSASSPANEKIVPARCGNEREVADLLELAARHDRRKGDALDGDAVVDRPPGDQVLDRRDQLAESGPAAVDARDAARKQQASVGQLCKELALLWSATGDLAHGGQTSLATSRSAALV